MQPKNAKTSRNSRLCQNRPGTRCNRTMSETTRLEYPISDTLLTHNYKTTRNMGNWCFCFGRVKYFHSANELRKIAKTNRSRLVCIVRPAWYPESRKEHEQSHTISKPPRYMPQIYNACNDSPGASNFGHAVNQTLQDKKKYGQMLFFCFLG